MRFALLLSVCAAPGFGPGLRLIREFANRDIPKVVDLYWTYLVCRRGMPPAELQARFADLYFDGPWGGAGSPSFVYEDESGAVLGFLGITTRTMTFAGECLRVGFLGNFVVHPSARSAKASSQLLEAMFAGTQDMFCTDSANNISRKVLQKAGFQLIPALNLHWSRPLRPSKYVLHALTRRMGGGARTAVQALGKPVAGLLDSLAGPKVNLLGPANTELRAEELGLETLLQCLKETNQPRKLRTVYDHSSLQWLVRFMEGNIKRGKLRKVLLRDARQSIVGWYIYHVNPGSVGEVVQIGGAQNRLDVINALLHDAYQHGAIALHGVADFEKLADYSDANCFFTCRGGWTVAQSRRTELIQSLLQGNPTLSRLDGEWCLNAGE